MILGSVLRRQGWWAEKRRGGQQIDFLRNLNLLSVFQPVKLLFKMSKLQWKRMKESNDAINDAAILSDVCFVAIESHCSAPGEASRPASVNFPLQCWMMSESWWSFASHPVSRRGRGGLLFSPCITLSVCVCVCVYVSFFCLWGPKPDFSTMVWGVKNFAGTKP